MQTLAKWFKLTVFDTNIFKKNVYTFNGVFEERKKERKKNMYLNVCLSPVQDLFQNAIIRAIG